MVCSAVQYSAVVLCTALEEGLTLSVELDGSVEAAVQGPLVDAVKDKPGRHRGDNSTRQQQCQAATVHNKTPVPCVTQAQGKTTVPGSSSTHHMGPVCPPHAANHPN